MSMTIFNMRLTGLTSHRWNIVHWTFLGLLVCYTVIALFTTLFQCDNVPGHFDMVAAGKAEKPLKCMSDDVIGSVLSSMHVIMDFCLLAVPIIVIYRVQMHRTTKARYIFVFGIGGLSSIGSIFRQIEQSKLKTDIYCQSLKTPSCHQQKANESVDNYVPFMQWTLVDITFGVVAANLPTVSVLLPQGWSPMSHHNKQATPEATSSENSYVKRASYMKRTGTLGQPHFIKQSKHKSQDWTVVADREDAPPVPETWDKESQSFGIVHDIGFELQYQDASRQNSCVEAEPPDARKGGLKS